MNLNTPQARLIRERIVPTMKKLNYRLYTDRPNLVSIRNRVLTNNTFNDSLFVFWLDDRDRLIRYNRYIITTTPGLPWLLNPMNSRGTAILQPGQYIDTYAIGFHGRGSFRHEALVQVLPVNVFRDNNRDEIIDKIGNHRGLFGINIHRASAWWDVTEKIDSFSAGCQVFQRRADFQDFMNICRDAKQNRFTYTLINETELIR